MQYDDFPVFKEESEPQMHLFPCDKNVAAMTLEVNFVTNKIDNVVENTLFI
jgi:hypothetical protein